MIWTKTTWLIYRRLRPFWLSGKTINTNIAIGFVRINFIDTKYPPRFFFLLLFLWKVTKNLKNILYGSKLEASIKTTRFMLLLFSPNSLISECQTNQDMKAFSSTEPEWLSALFSHYFFTIFLPSSCQRVGVGSLRKKQPKK